MFKRKKKKNNAGKIRRARVKNIRKAQTRKIQSRKRLVGKRKKQKKKINWKKVGVVFLIFCFSVLTGWVLFFSKAMQIDEIEIIGYDDKKDELVELVRKTTKKTLFNQNINNNLVLFPSDRLAKNIQEKYAVIKKIEVQKVFPNKLVINITKRQQVFLWAQKENCQFLDNDGSIMEEFKCVNDDKELLKICANKKEILKLDCQVFIKESEEEDIVDKETVQDVIEVGQQIVEEIKTTFYFDEELITIVPNSTSKEIRIRSKNYGEVWFSIDKDLIKQLKKFRALLEKKINQSNLENMLYIDLRLNNKIIYRFKEGYGNSDEL